MSFQYDCYKKAVVVGLCRPAEPVAYVANTAMVFYVAWTVMVGRLERFPLSKIECQVMKHQKLVVILVLAVSLIGNDMSLKICRAADDCGSRGAWDIRVAVKC